MVREQARLKKGYLFSQSSGFTVTLKQCQLLLSHQQSIRFSSHCLSLQCCQYHNQL